jgi:excisionase family DNA binding protein
MDKTSMVDDAKMATKPIYTTHEVSRLLQVNPRSVVNWTEQGLLPSYRTPGRHRRIRRDDLLAFLRTHHFPIPATLIDGKFSVLVVGDEENVVDSIRTFFLGQGSYELASTSDGITALIEIGRTRPDLLILDVKASGLNAIDACRRIKSYRANKTVIIALGASPDSKEKILQAGADAFLQRVDLEKLLAEAGRLLRVL